MSKKCADEFIISETLAFVLVYSIASDYVSLIHDIPKMLELLLKVDYFYL